MKTIQKAIISGGGTGGHVFPAIAIANTLKERYPQIELLFIGAEGKMEMEKVPAAGYVIEGLPISGIQRRLTLKNLLVPFKLLKSQQKAKKIIKSFSPDIVIGVGGYASAPTLRMASKLHIPTLIQEQNSYPGVTNKILSKKAHTICVAYEKMDTYFPKEKIVLTGNPVRKDIISPTVSKEEAINSWGLSVQKKTVLCMGGSLGARTLNESLAERLSFFKENDVQLIWQTGKSFYPLAVEKAAEYPEHIKVFEFINRMDIAYTAADVIISRAGALAISELCLVGKPAVLVPSPNVSEDHQTKNAMALVEKQAAMMVKDADARIVLISTVGGLLNNSKQQSLLSENCKKMGIPNAADKIVDEIEKIINL